MEHQFSLMRRKKILILLGILLIAHGCGKNYIQDRFVMIGCEEKTGEKKLHTTIKDIQAKYNSLGPVEYAQKEALIYDRETGKSYAWDDFEESLTRYTGERHSDDEFAIRVAQKISKNRTKIMETTTSWLINIYGAKEYPNEAVEIYDLDEMTKLYIEEGKKDVLSKCLIFDLPREIDIILEQEND